MQTSNLLSRTLRTSAVDVDRPRFKTDLVGNCFGHVPVLYDGDEDNLVYRVRDPITCKARAPIENHASEVDLILRAVR